jgi:hypothetical protein
VVALKLVIMKLAVVTPPLLLSVPWPRLVPPSEKITTPLGLAKAVLPGPFTCTVAVNVTTCPVTELVGEAVTVVLVAALFTDCCSVPLLPWKVLSPVYEAVIVWLPVLSVDVVKLAVRMPPVVLSIPWPRLVPLSEKITTPVGVPAPFGVTVAVKVTAWPDTDGLPDVVTIVLLVLPALLTDWMSVPELAM